MDSQSRTLQIGLICASNLRLKFCFMNNRLGQFQSPININFTSKFEVEPNKLKFKYEQDDEEYCELSNDGYKVIEK